MKKFNDHYTLMFVPEDKGKTFTLRIPKYVFHSILLFLIIFFSGIILLLFKSGEIAAKLQVLSLIRMENEKLLKENDDLRRIIEKINHLDQLSKYLNRLSSIPALHEERDHGITNISIKKNENIISYNPQKFQHLINGDKISSLPNIPPVEGWMTRPFLPDTTASNRGHQGVDFAATLGTPIKATAPGVVGKIENDKYFGLIITVIHDNGYATRYGHCSQILVSKHEHVNRGQTIALVGNTGRSTAPHLHYEVIKDGRNIDPTKHILVHKD